MKKNIYEISPAFKYHSKIIQKEFKIENGYPTILKSTGHPIYKFCKGKEKQILIKKYLKSYLKETKEWEPIFIKLKKGTLISTSIGIYQITKIQVKCYDNQFVYIRNTYNKKNKDKIYLYDFLKYIDKGIYKLF